MALYRDPFTRLQMLADGEDPDAPAPPRPAPLTRDEVDRMSRERSALRRSESGRALHQGAENIRASGLAMRGLLRSAFDEEGATRDFQRAQAIQQEAAEFGPRVQSIEDIDGVGSALEWGRNVALTQLPNIALTAGTGGTVGGVGRAVAGAVARQQGARALAKAGARAAVSRDGSTALRGAALRSSTGRALREQGARNAEDLAHAQARGTAVGQAVGGAGAGTMLQSSMAPGVVLDEDPANTASFGERAGTAALGAAVTGSLEALPVMALFRRYGLAGAEEAVTGGVLARVSKQFAKQGTAEAATEVAQTMGERLAHRYVNENIEIIGPEAYADYLNAAAGGFIGGGIFGAPAGIRGVGSNSEAGKRYVESMRDYMGRFKRKPPPEGGSPAPVPGQPMDSGPSGGAAPGPVERVVRRAKEFTDRATAGVADASAQVKKAADDITAKFQENLNNLRDDGDVNSSWTEILDADALNTMMNDPDNPGRKVDRFGLSPAMNLVDTNVLREWRAEGVSTRVAAAASMIPNVQQRRELLDSGALYEAARAIAGEDPADLDNDLITQFQDALGPPGDSRRNAFNRTAKTAFENRPRAEDIELPGEGLVSDAAETRDPTQMSDDASYEERQTLDAGRPLRTSEASIKAWRAKEGKPTPRGTPKNTVMFTDADGIRRGMSGRTLGRWIVEAREADPVLAAQPMQIQLAEVLADMQLQGYQIEPQTLQAMELGNDWSLPAATAKAVREGMAPYEGRRQGAASSPFVPAARPRTEQEQRTLNREAGLNERVELQGAEDPSRLDDEPRVLGPRSGSPQGLRATGGQTPRSARASRMGQAQRESISAQRELDTILIDALELDAGFDNQQQRRAAMADAMRSEQPGATKQRLRAAAERYARALEAEQAANIVRRGEKPAGGEPDVSPIRLQEGQTIDAPIDQNIARGERGKTPIEADDFNDVDDLLERFLGRRPGGPEGFRQRRQMLRQAITGGRIATVPEDGRRPITTDFGPDGKLRRSNATRRRVALSANERAELLDAAGRYGDAQFVSALRAYQRDPSGKNLERLERAQAAAERGASIPGTREVRDATLTKEFEAQRDEVEARQDTENVVQRAIDKAFGGEVHHSADISSLIERRAQQVRAQAEAALNELSAEDRDILMNDRPSRPDSLLPASLQQEFREWARENDRGEADFAAENLNETETAFLEDAADGSWEVTPIQRAQAANIIAYGDPRGAMRGETNYSAPFTNEGVDAEIARYTGMRSRAGLGALIDRIVNSTLPDTAKEKLRARVQAARKALSETAAAAAARQLNGMGIERALPKDEAHLQEFRAALEAAGAFHVDRTTLDKALTAVRSMASPDQKKLIDTLVKTGAAQHIRVGATSIQRDPVVHGFHQLSGSDSYISLTVPLHAYNGRSVDAVALLLHEAIHGATSLAERRNPEARRAVSTMLAHARNQARKMGIDPDSYYGLAETQEFLAEVFTNPELQAMLAQMPAANTKKFQSLWHEFKDFVRKLVGLPRTDATLLDEVLTVGLDMARETRDRRDGVFSEMFADSEVNAAPTNVTATPAAGSKPSDYFSVMTPDNRRYFEAFFRRGDVFRRVKEALPANLHNELHSADKGPALLVNTGLAMAMSGQLKTEASPLRELWDTISKIVQVPTRAAYGRELLKNIQARGAVTRRGLETDAHKLTLTKPGVTVTRFVNSQIAPRVRALATDMNQRMRNSGVPAISQIATLISQRTGDFRADGMDSYAARHVAERNKRFNQFYDIIGKWDDKHRQAVGDALRSNNTPAGQVGVDAERVRAFYRDMRDYLVDAKVLSPGQNVDDYFPIAMDHERVVERRPAFLRLFSAPNIAEAARAADLRILKEKRAKAKTAKATAHFDARIAEVTKMTHQQIAESWYQFASVRNPTPRVAGLTFAEGDVDPSFRPGHRRLMDFVYKAGTPAQLKQFAEFQDQQFDRVTAIYIARATKRAEWSRMNLSTRLSALMTEAANQGATPKQLQMAKDYIDQAMGAYGTDWHPWISRIADSFGVNLPPFASFQRLQAGLMTYHNLRLLPLALASSLIDPLGVMVRTGGGVGTAFASYRDAVRALRNEGGTDALRALAEDMGVIERHAVSEALSHLHGSPADPHGLSSRINQQLFKWNGLEFVTKFSRLAALAAGQRFLIKHGAGANETSLRYLRELNLVPSDIVVRDGTVVRSAKIDAALSRFVDESVVRPTGQQRPGWQNDPHFQWAAQYKGYLYSFWNTVVRRGMLELGEGNPAVLAPLALYIPIQAMGEMARDALQGDDDDREWQDYAWMGVERSGLLGPKFDIGKNANEDLRRRSSVVNSMVGPTGQQLAHAYDVATGERSVGRFGRQALPLSTLHDDWFTRTEVDTDG